MSYSTLTSAHHKVGNGHDVDVITNQINYNLLLPCLLAAHLKSIA